MSTPALLSIQQRLSSTSSLLLERSRVISLKLPPSASSQNQIVRNLTSIKNDLSKLETEYQVVASTPGKKGGKSKEGELTRQLREVGESFDRLVEIFGEDDVGREKAKVLRRQINKPAEPVSNTSEDDDPLGPNRSSTPTLSVNTSKAGPQSVPRLSVEPPTPAANNSHLPFRDYPEGRSSNSFPPHTYLEDEEDERDDREIMDSQELAMQDQDDRLNLLSHSIGRQNHLSLQIGSELEEQHELLEDVDGAMDRTTARLGGARKRLDKVANDAKQYGSTITIVALIVILLLLIIVFKT